MGLPWRARRVAPTLPATSPFPSNLTGDGLIWQKLWRAVCAQTNTPSIPRTLRLANSNFRQRQLWYSIQLTMERFIWQIASSTSLPHDLTLGARADHASALDTIFEFREVSTNSNPVLLCRIDGHSLRRQKKTSVQVAILLPKKRVILMVW